MSDHININTEQITEVNLLRSKRITVMLLLSVVCSKHITSVNITH